MAISIWDKQTRIASWQEKDAVALANKVLPLVGKRVVLYGGGGAGSHIGKLASVRVVKQLHYWRHGRGGRRIEGEHFPKTGEFSVKVRLTELDPPIRYRYTKDWKKVGQRTFEPALGSWRIAPITSKPRARKLRARLINPVTKPRRKATRKR